MPIKWRKMIIVKKNDLDNRSGQHEFMKAYER